MDQSSTESRGGGRGAASREVQKHEKRAANAWDWGSSSDSGAPANSEEWAIKGRGKQQGKSGAAFHQERHWSQKRQECSDYALTALFSSTSTRQAIGQQWPALGEGMARVAVLVTSDLTRPSARATCLWSWVGKSDKELCWKLGCKKSKMWGHKQRSRKSRLCRWEPRALRGDQSGTQRMNHDLPEEWASNWLDDKSPSASAGQNGQTEVCCKPNALFPGRRHIHQRALFRLPSYPTWTWLITTLMPGLKTALDTPRTKARQHERAEAQARSEGSRGM